jgi:3-oxoacyl-[acyl-carrier-protein] synthase-3
VGGAGLCPAGALASHEPRRREGGGSWGNHGFPHALIAAARNGFNVSITGLGCRVPDRVLTNEELSKLVDTSDEWIVERTGIRERRVAGPEEALSDLCLPACRDALEQAGVGASDIDLIIVATVTPDMLFPSTAAILADQLGAPDAAAYDLSAGCTGFMYALAQAYGMLAAGLASRALVVGGDTLSKIVDWHDRTTCVLFGDGAGAVVLDRVREGGFLGFELGADGSGGPQLFLPAGGSREPTSADTFAEGRHFVQMNGREVFKFATRVLVSSAEKVLSECGLTVDDVDVYVPHQANVRIIDHATKKLGIPAERVVVNVDRYGNTSSGSIPLALADAAADGRLKQGSTVLMTGMGAGLTWGSSVIEWTNGGKKVA